jgi:hypothetical protein
MSPSNQPKISPSDTPSGSGSTEEFAGLTSSLDATSSGNPDKTTVEILGGATAAAEKSIEDLTRTFAIPQGAVPTHAFIRGSTQDVETMFQCGAVIATGSFSAFRRFIEANQERRSRAIEIFGRMVGSTTPASFLSVQGDLIQETVERGLRDQSRLLEELAGSIREALTLWESKHESVSLEK